MDREGNVYVARGGCYNLHQVTPQGVITRLMDQQGDGKGHC